MRKPSSGVFSALVMLTRIVAIVRLRFGDRRFSFVRIVGPAIVVAMTSVNSCSFEPK